MLPTLSNIPHRLDGVKPALVRLPEWQIDQELETSQCRLADEREHGCGSDEEDADTCQNVGP